MQVEDQQLVDLDLFDPAHEALFVDDELIDMHGRQVVDQLYLVPGAAVVLTGFDLADTVPERAGHHVITTGQHRHVVDQLVGAVVLGSDPTRSCLEAHIDVFGHQHHAQVLVAGVQVDQLVDDFVVVQVFRQQAVGLAALAHQDRQQALGPALATLDGHADLDVLGRSFTQGLVDQADGLAAFGGNAVVAAFEFVELLKHDHRDGDVVFFEVQQCVWIVDQYVGIKHIKDWLVGRRVTSMIIHTRSPLWEPFDAIPGRCCASIRPPSAPEGRQVQCPHAESWKTPPVLQVSAV